MKTFSTNSQTPSNETLQLITEVSKLIMKRAAIALVLILATAALLSAQDSRYEPTASIADGTELIAENYDFQTQAEQAMNWAGEEESSSIESPIKKANVITETSINGCSKVNLQKEISALVTVPEVTKRYGITDVVKVTFTADADNTLQVLSLKGSEPSIVNHVKRSLDGKDFEHGCYLQGLTYSWTIKVKDI